MSTSHLLASTFMLLCMLTIASCQQKKETLSSDNSLDHSSDNTHSTSGTAKVDMKSLLTKSQDVDNNASEKPTPTSTLPKINKQVKTVQDKNKKNSINRVSNTWKKTLFKENPSDEEIIFDITPYLTSPNQKTKTLKPETKEAESASNSLELSYDTRQFTFMKKWQAGLAIGSDDDEGSFILSIRATDSSNNQVLISIHNDFETSNEHLETLPVVGLYDLNEDDADLALFIDKSLIDAEHGEIQIVTLVNGTIFGFFSFGSSEANKADYSGFFQGEIDIICTLFFSKKYCQKGWTQF